MGRRAYLCLSSHPLRKRTEGHQLPHKALSQLPKIHSILSSKESQSGQTLALRLLPFQGRVMWFLSWLYKNTPKKPDHL